MARKQASGSKTKPTAGPAPKGGKGTGPALSKIARRHLKGVNAALAPKSPVVGASISGTLAAFKLALGELRKVLDFLHERGVIEAPTPTERARLAQSSLTAVNEALTPLGPVTPGELGQSQVRAILAVLDGKGVVRDDAPVR